MFLLHVLLENLIVTVEKSQSCTLTKEAHSDCFRKDRAMYGNLGDHSQSALGPDEQMLQVVTCVIFLHRSEAVYDCAIRFHLSSKGNELYDRIMSNAGI